MLINIYYRKPEKNEIKNAIKIAPLKGDLVHYSSKQFLLSKRNRKDIETKDDRDNNQNR